jgi:hypothetical protein
MTLNADERFTVVTGDGIDTITGTDSAATTVVNTGGGDDVLNITAATYLGVNDLGAGTGDKVILAATDLSAGATWQNIEILQLAGNTTLSLAQLDNDTSYEIVGSNGVITATGVTSIDLSNVSFQAGNTSSYNLTGTAAADTITGSDAGDTIKGGDGADTLVGGLGADDYIYDADADIGTAGTLTAAQGDAVTFVSADDEISLIGDFLTANLTGTAADAVNAVAYAAGVDMDGAGTGNDSVQLIAAGAATATLNDGLTIADLVTALGTITNEANGDERILAFVTGDGNTVVYKYTADGDNTLEEGELQLIAIFSDTMVAADFTFA